LVRIPRRKARGRCFSDTMASGTADPTLAQAANQLAAIAPMPVLIALSNRVEACRSKFLDILDAPGGTYLPQDIDDATEAVKLCACRELRRLRSVNGTLPSGKLTQWWQEYRCS
jgi:hypothetical protein